MKKDKQAKNHLLDAASSVSQMESRCEALALYRKVVPSTLLRVVIYFALWTVVALASAIHWWFYPQGIYPYSWWELFAVKASVWYTWAALTPFILWLGARYRLGVEFCWRRLGLLLLIGAVVTSLYLVAYTQWIILLTNQQPQPVRFGAMLAFVISRHSTYYFLAFWGVIGTEHLVAYYHRYLERERLAAQLQTELSSAQFERLKNQLNPHFLFNTLNTISSLVLSDKKTEAYDTLADFAELLRISLDRNESQFVSLADELDFSRLYLDLMLRRFPERLAFDWRVDPESLSAEVPNMILQPLIENSIKHSIETVTTSDRLSLASTISAGRLIIELRNPFDPSTETAPESGFGIGLSHIRQRLQHHYGCDFQFEASALSGDFVVVLSIPYLRYQKAVKHDRQGTNDVARSNRR